MHLKTFNSYMLLTLALFSTKVNDEVSTDDDKVCLKSYDYIIQSII